VTPDDYAFNSFTPYRWQSRSGEKRDDNGESLLFTLKNLHAIEPRRFSIKEDRKHEAVFFGSKGLRLGRGAGLAFAAIAYSGGFRST
jgi:hypothetical protein